MKKYLKADEWSIIEEGFDAGNHMASESIFSLGNGRFGQRANFEEAYSGDMLQGSYVGGVYYPDKTRVGWWKNGYPEYFAKVMNSPNWTAVGVAADGEALDLSACRVDEFIRTLNMKEGTLSRRFRAVLENGIELQVETFRFISMAAKQNAAVSYSVTPLNADVKVAFSPTLDGDVYNEDSNYGEQFWTVLETAAEGAGGYLHARTNKLDFHCACGMQSVADIDGEIAAQSDDTSATSVFDIEVKQGQTVTLRKYVSVLSSLNHPAEQLKENTMAAAAAAAEKGFRRPAGGSPGSVGAPMGAVRYPHRGRRRRPAGHPLQHFPAAPDLYG
jgi:maltose phosphorylase